MKSKAKSQGRRSDYAAASPESSMPRHSRFSLARTLNLSTTALFILALIIDLYLAQSNRLAPGRQQLSTHSINLILLATTIVNAGKS
jgi:hypothetical protein